jgi:hypothetical protein
LWIGKPGICVCQDICSNAMALLAGLVESSGGITVVMARVAAIVLRPSWNLSLKKLHGPHLRRFASIATLATENVNRSGQTEKNETGCGRAVEHLFSQLDFRSAS